jgi:Flp pilus assembly protein TadD
LKILQSSITEVTWRVTAQLLAANAGAYNRSNSDERNGVHLSSTGAVIAKEFRLVSRPPNLSDASREKRSTVLCLLLVLVTLAFYNPVVHNGFTNLDDDVYIVNNPHVRAGLTWDTVKWAFTSRDAANWHPLTWLSHALDCTLFKLNPVGPHYVNVLLHAINAVLLFLLLEGATGFTWPSLMVAALFALHPMNVESVAWAAERKNVLSTLLLLLAMRAYQRYVRQISIKKYLPVAVFFALGLMAKPEIITLPFVLLLWDYWPLGRMGQGNISPDEKAGVSSVIPSVAPQSFSFLLLEKIPLLLLSAGSAAMTLIAQSGAHAVRTASTRVRFGNAVVAYVRYLDKAFWPSRLAALYPHLGRLLPTWQIMASAAVLLLLTALVLRSRRRYLIVGWFWFLGTLVPVIGLVQVGVQSMADRYAYLPFIGLFICVVWGIAEFAHQRRIGAAWLLVPAVVVLAAFGMITRHQIGSWHDSETLWIHTLSVTERNYSAHDGLARAYAEQGRIDEAIAQHNAAEGMHAYASSEMVSIALFEQAHGRMQEAIQQLSRAADAATDANSRALALGCLGSAFLQVGDLGRARTAYTTALQQSPDNGVALVGAGLLAEREGDFSSAVTQISRAMQFEPTDVGYLLLAQALRRVGDAAEAERAVAKAQKVSSNISQAQQAAAQILATAGIKND